MNKLGEVLQSLKKKGKKQPDVRVGDTVKVYVKIREGEKERLQVFEGIVIKKRRGENASFTVRKISYGVGVERVFAFASPSVEKIEIIQRGKTRRARLFYLRGRRGGEATIEGTTEGIDNSDSEPDEKVRTNPSKNPGNHVSSTLPAS